MFSEEMKPKLAFDDFPAFYEQDNRRNRGFNPVSKVFLETKFSVLLPPDMVKDKHILDLGSCYGAAGQWVLFNGAISYTGVEVQKNYAQQSQELLSHWGQRATVVQQDVRSYLTQAASKHFDLVVVAGILYHFIDTKSIIDAICRLCKESVIVETNYPPGMRSGILPLDVAVTEYVSDQEVNLAEGNQSMFGISATTSLPALDILFGLNGFNKQQKLNFPISPDTIIYDEHVLGDTDLHIRFAAHYYCDAVAKPLVTLESNLPQQQGEKRHWTDDPVAQNNTKAYQQQAHALKQDDDTGLWKFDANIAQQFEQIARREIPDYLRVIDLCIRVISKSKLQQPKIIDVGSALGETLKQLHQQGYENIYGVECSADMLAKSFDKATLIHSEQFPEQYAPFDYVINNWTLHFIPERVAYLAAIKRSLAPSGTLILTDKVSSSECTHELYYDMKRTNGVSEQEIEQKRQQIEGVLVTSPFTWYIETLDSLGFEQIEIINANTAFVTFMAINPSQ
ncbi:class I SAM-dependent methyltransferase [Candidatus Albibeggiatoa sp. nov. BB20]|uniref:class I SAM-dependent methyltransferase n=1 Tax=Candidatus Albibeggiatoa sp. nov. BB20 TaxID=3162723 RepID=UPI003365984B